MKKILILPFWIAMLQLAASAQSLDTQGDFSPTVVAKNFTATYGVRSDAILAILDVYAKQGLPPQDRKARTEALIKDYKNAIPQVKGISQLSKDEQNSLGIAAEAGLVQALNWDMFARQYYLSTKGAYSPAIVAQGDVSIWYGIPEPALRTLAGRLEANAVELGEFGAQLEELAEKYNALKKEFETYGPGDPVVRQAEQLLEEGKLEEAEALLESDYRVSKKRLAYKAYLYGKTKELLLKYEEATAGYRDATTLDPTSFDYLLAYGALEATLAHYDNATKILESSLHSIGQTPKPTGIQFSTLLTNLGDIKQSQSKFEDAIDYYNRAFAIDSAELGIMHPAVAKDLNKIGMAWSLLGMYDRAIACYERALGIDSVAFGKSHQDVGTCFNNLSGVWFSRGNYNKAIEYSKLAIGIDTLILAPNHQDIARDLSNLLGGYYANGNYDQAIYYANWALRIDQGTFGNVHPKVSRDYANLATILRALGEYDLALTNANLALGIDTIVFHAGNATITKDLNKLGTIWFNKGEWDKALSFFLTALAHDSIAYGPSGPLKSAILNNIGRIWEMKEQYDIAMNWFHQAIRLDTTDLGYFHPSIARDYCHLAACWRGKKDFANALSFLELAIGIDTMTFGLSHPIVAEDFRDFGMVYKASGEYEKAILNLERGISIFLRFHPETHPWLEEPLWNLAQAENALGLEFVLQKRFDQAEIYFKRALDNRESQKEALFTATCLVDLGMVRKRLGNNEQALQAFYEAERTVESLTKISLPKEASLPDSIRKSQKYQLKRDSTLLGPLSRTLRLHRIQCLQALGRHKEAKSAAKTLITDALAAKNEIVIADLRKDGWIKD